jgi:MoaA/NifB/PqqE/SkfB family radical SAM enzyme
MDRKAPALKLLQIDLTDECPLFCVHCSNDSGPLRKTHFPIEALARILMQAKGLGAESVVYSGGEPLRYPHLEQAVSAATSLGLTSTIFTTGIDNDVSRLEVESSRWSSLKGVGLQGAAFSIYSGPKNREFHNRVVRCKPLRGDAFDVNERAIRAAGFAGLRKELHFIPSGTTVRDLQEIYRWAQDLECGTLHLQMPTYQGRNATGGFLSLSYDEELQLKDAALNLRVDATLTSFHISRFWRSRWDGTSGCGAATEQLIIRADGTISPCNACKYTSRTSQEENVLASSEDLSVIWGKSPALLEVRRARIEGSIPVRCEGVLAIISKRTACTV